MFEAARSFATRMRRRLRDSHRAGGAVVLAYHRIVDAPPDHRNAFVTPTHFAEHLAVICAHGVPMSLSELVDRAERDALPPRAVAVTIDDGYEDALRGASTLAHASVPATVFVCAEPVATGQRFPWDRNPPGAADSSLHRPLTHDALIALAGTPGITIGSHTYSHPVLASLAIEEQSREITRGRDWLEQVLGVPVTLFAYPYGGRREVSRDSVEAARAAGVRIGCSTIGGTVHAGVDRLLVPRITVGNWSGAEFAERWAGWQ